MPGDNAGITDDGASNAGGIDNMAADDDVAASADDGAMDDTSPSDTDDVMAADDGSIEDSSDTGDGSDTGDDSSTGDSSGGVAVDPDAPPPEGAPNITSELTIEPNPNSAITAYVSWTTDVPGTSEVQFGVGDVELSIASAAEVTDHRVLVVGMHEQSDYVIRAVSSNAMGADALDGSFTTGQIPSEVARAQLTADQPAASQSGWTLTNIMPGGAGGGFGGSGPAIAVIYDEAGEIVWYYINGTSADNRGDISVDYLENGNVLIGPAPGENPREVDLAGNIVWEGPSPSGTPMSHHAGKIDNGNIVVIRDPSSGGITGAAIEEYTYDNQMVWSWSLLDNLTPPESATGDWCHANAVTIDTEADVGYLNCRFLGIFKFQRSTGEILWHMAGTHTPDMPGDFTFPTAGSQFNDAHDPEFHPDGTLLLYDNGGYAGLGGGGGGQQFHSRVLEYQVDEAGLSAELLWEFPGSFDVDSWYSDDWYAAFWGDSDKLANDNVLITAGLKGADLQTRIFEVTRDGQVVWEITLPNNQGSYRAQRISPPPVTRL